MREKNRTYYEKMLIKLKHKKNVEKGRKLKR